MTINTKLIKAAQILSHRREISKKKGGKERIAWARQVIAAAHN